MKNLPEVISMFFVSVIVNLKISLFVFSFNLELSVLCVHIITVKIPD